MREFQRKPTRHPNWDYTTPGYYFVTIVVHQHACLLGEIINDKILLSPAGEIVRQTWLTLPEHYPNVRVEPFVIMPNHIHGIIELREIFSQQDIDSAGKSEFVFRRGRFPFGKGQFVFRRGGFLNPPLQDKNFSLQDTDKTTPSNPYHHGLSEIVRGFKTWSARQINELQGTTGAPFWQRSFYDSIIKNERHLRNVEAYILENPRRWEEDKENW